MIESVREKFNRAKIKKMQLDPFGFCNAKCWFCPVRYIPQPEEGSGNMPISLVEKIFSDLSEEKRKSNGVVDPRFNFFTTAHYNEVLLYKNIEQLFELARKHKFTTYVLSNGISLNPRNSDLISEYRDVVVHIGLNIPAFQKDLWAKRSGFSPDQFDRLMSNIEYAKEKLSYLDFHVIVNGISHNQVNSGWVTLGPEFKDHNYDLENEHREQLQLAEKIFPNQYIQKGQIFDRAGYIDNILSNKEWTKRNLRDKKIVGCSNFGDRTSEWIHVNSAGKVFLCCNDYNFEYVYGDLTTQNLAEIWRSEKHIQTIEKAFGGICTGCTSAVLKEDKKYTGAIATDQMRFSR